MTLHALYFNKQHMHAWRSDYGIILHQTSIKNTCKTHQYTHTCCLFMANTSSSFHAMNENQHRTVAIAVICSYLDSTWWAWDHNLILYRTLTTNTFKFKQTAIQTYFLLVQIEPPRHHSIHSFNVCRVAIAIIAYLHNTLGWDYGLILHWTPIIPPSNPISHTYTNTYINTYTHKQTRT